MKGGGRSFRVRRWRRHHTHFAKEDVMKRLLMFLFLSVVFVAAAPKAFASDGQVLFADDFSTNPNTSGKWTIRKDYSDPYTGIWDSLLQAFYLTTVSGGCTGINMLANVDLAAKKWEASFKYKIGGTYYYGADGIVFMFYKKKDYVPGGGGLLGFNDPGWNPVPGLGIEFDNWYNGEFHDISSSHIALIENSVGNHLVSVNDFRTEDNLWHAALVKFNEGQISVSVDGGTIINYLLPVPNYTYTGVGFSAGICGGKNDQIVKDFVLTVPAVPVPPMAEAGPDQTVYEFTSVVLDGSASKDPDGDPLVFQWTQVGGTPVALDTADPARPTFTAPLVPQGGETLTFQLVVNDGKLSSTPDIVNISVKNINHPPVADAGPDMLVGEKSQVTLDGSFSYDRDGDPITYSWLQTAGLNVELSDPVAAKPAFAAPTVGVDGATLTFQLTVSDGIESMSDTVQVVVENLNHPPVADAGVDQLRNEGGNVVLNGALSSDIDGDALSHIWKQLEGVPVELSDDHGQSPSFTAPLVGSEGASLVFQLIVNDGLIDSAPARVTVSVLDINSPPSCGTAKANPYVLWPPNHKLVPVGITGVKDAENDQVTITLLGVRQDEPVNGLGDGDTGPDAVIEGNALLIRAERAGSGNGRTYRATFRADDSFGENCVGTFTVIVPHARNGSSIDDGPGYDSLQP